MIEDPLPSKVDWPKWTWGQPERWLSVIGVVVAVVMLVYPGLVLCPIYVRVGLAVCCIVLVPISIFVVAYIFRLFWIGIRRSLRYRDICALAKQRYEELCRAKEMVLCFAAEVTARRTFELDKVQLYKEALYIILKKKRGAHLREGDRIAVIDTQIGDVMGQFEVNEVRQGHYVAKSTGSVSSIWLGFIHQTGRAECSPPPDTIAILMQKDTENDV